MGKKGQKGKSRKTPIRTGHGSSFFCISTRRARRRIIVCPSLRKTSAGNAEGALELYQASGSGTDPNLSGAWRNLGALLRQRGQFAEARHCTEQALKLDANDGSLWGNYGNVLRDQGLLEESCQAFQEGLKRAPGSKGSAARLAISLGRRSEHQQVIQLLTPVVEQALDPKQPLVTTR